MTNSLESVELTELAPGHARLLNDKLEANEIGNSERLVKIARGKIHWVDPWKSWIVYEDGRWIYDFNGIQVMEYAKSVVRALWALADDARPHSEVLERLEAVKNGIGTAERGDIFAKEIWDFHLAHVKKSESEPMMRRMVSLARGIPGISVDPSDIDAEPWLFNTHGATIDLRTGIAREPDPGDLLMQRADVIYDPNATCPMWLKYLSEWQPDPDVRAFLQKVCASAITGIPLSKLFINVGSGANGKSVFFDALISLLGTYAIVPDDTLFMDSRNETHSEEKAKLKGARMMVVNETDRTGRLNEPAVKKYNGGDMINARHLYGRPFSFRPTHSSFMHTNHKPSISGTDLGVWRRIEIIEWLFTVEANKRDPLIGEKLRKEYPGILNWLIQGLASFRADMTISVVPEVIKRNGETYREEQDHVGNFLRDAYDGGFLTESASNLRSKYEIWCAQQGFKPWTAPNVGKELTSRGYVSKLKRVDGKPIRVWDYPEIDVTSVTPLHESETSSPNFHRYTVTPLQIAENVTDVTVEGDSSVTPITPGQDPFLDPCNSVTVFSHSSTYDIQDVEKLQKERIEVDCFTVTPLHLSSDWEPSPEFWEEQERQWRIDRGFEVAYREPTQTELDDLAAAELEDWEEQNKPPIEPDWV